MKKLIAIVLALVYVIGIGASGGDGSLNPNSTCTN